MGYFGLWQHSLRQGRLSGGSENNVKRMCIMIAGFLIATCSFSQWHTQEFCWGGGIQQIQLRTEDRENGDLRGGSPLVRSFGGSYNLIQEISYSKIFLIFGILRIFMMTINLFVSANVKQLRT